MEGYNGSMLKMEKVSKCFGRNEVLSNVDFEVKPGQIVAIVGQNGAGKSTLMNIIAGVVPYTKGHIYLEGNEIRPTSPREAAQLGIRMVHQELSLFPNMTVMENLMIGNLPKTKMKFLDRRVMYEESKKRLAVFGLDIDPNIKVGDMPIAQQQMVEICREIDDNTKVLILDEPTSAIGNEEVDALFKLIDQLKTEKYISIIYISHRLSEIITLADYIYVLRDGVVVNAIDKHEISHEILVKMIVGENRTKEIDGTNILKAKRRENHQNKPMALEFRNICSKKLDDVSFGLREGEVLGIAGLMGSGRTEILKTIYGAMEYASGEIKVGQKTMPNKYTCREALQQKICLIPEDRKNEGLNLGISIKHNVTLPIIMKLTDKLGLINEKREVDMVMEQMETFRVKASGIAQTVGSLSGGNQQKICLAKWMVKEPKILLMDEPTRGVDIGAKEDIFDTVDRLVANGVSILFVSSEFKELLRVCDRILVLLDGKIIRECMVDDTLTEEKLIFYATGGEHSSAS